MPIDMHEWDQINSAFRKLNDRVDSLSRFGRGLRSEAHDQERKTESIEGRLASLERVNHLLWGFVASLLATGVVGVITHLRAIATLEAEVKHHVESIQELKTRVGDLAKETSALDRRVPAEPRKSP